MIVVGIDEVGRGCWAGPVMAAAACLPTAIDGLADSKVLSKKRREELALEIEKTAIYAVGEATVAEVDSLGLTEAVRLAMRRAYDALGVTADHIIIDGNYNYLSEIPGSQAVIKADGTIPAVSAASIVAKVARDGYMARLDPRYDRWQFAKHVGYGTALHRELLQQYGISDLHRKSFAPIRRLLS